jgi:hypothetical protein
MSDGFTVHPDTLQAAGQNAQTVADQIPNETQAVGGPSETAVGGLTGWASAPALHNCTTAWQGLLNSLQVRMNDQGQILIANAMTYRNCDSAVANQLAASGTPGPVTGRMVPDPFGTVVK